MATTDPLIGATIYANSDPALGGQQIGDVANDIVPFTIPRFTSTSTRDSAYASYVAAGGVIKDGMTCWCDTPGSYYDRISGAWVPRARTVYNSTALDGTAVPATARVVRVRTSQIVAISNSVGGFAVPYGFSFTKLMSVTITPGDNTGGLGWTVPVVANHTLTTANGIAYVDNGTRMPNGQNIRVEVDAVGYI